MHLANYLGLIHRSELSLADAFRQVGEGHPQEVDVYHLAHRLAAQYESHTEKNKPSPTATARTRRRSPSVSIPSSSAGRAPGASGSCAVCRTFS